MSDPEYRSIPLWQRWSSPEAANAWLREEKLDVAHPEQNEYEVVNSPGYEYVRCTRGGEPMLRGRGCNDTECGFSLCSPLEYA